MTRALAVLRPEPGNAITAARIETLGLTALRLPLFAVRPLAWSVPDPAGFDALLLTSANALRHGGTGLANLRHLPVVAVGATTAQAACDAGFEVVTTGESDAAAVVAQAQRSCLLHLAGREHRSLPGVTSVIVYASDFQPVDVARMVDSVALVHSPRAARCLAEIAARPRIRLAAISAAAAEAAGAGWETMAVAETPTDEALIAAARRLAD